MKLNKEQLLETIRDTIYEVLEEEIDRRLQEAKTSKARKLNESKNDHVKALKAAKARAARRAKIQERKAQLKEAYNRLTAAEKKLAPKK